MKKQYLLFLLLSPCCLHAQSTDYAIRPVAFTNVKFNDTFWLPRIKTNIDVTIPASFERCESTGRIKNFEMAAARSGKFCTTFPFDDTDIYKTIEGASYSLSLYPDKKLESYIDGLIQKVGKAQEPDGYLYTARTIDPLHPHEWSGNERWVKERELSHELYNSGHLYEAAVAHYQATKKKTLLNIALKNADLVCSVFGPGKRAVAPGHEIVEMGLIKLYRVTGNKEYLQTARFFIDQRGLYTGYNKASSDPWKNGKYFQDDEPVTEQDEAEGHAVRAGYLYSAMADVAALTGDKKMLSAIDKIWDNMVSKKIYVQGGLGAIPSGERFGGNYELPNATAYNETCAAIANVYWNQRMFLLHGDSKYIDILEKSLYNGLISGVGLDGKSFFYTNAMQVTNNFTHKSLEPARAGWFECSCCPTNMTRLLPSIPGYTYAQRGNNIYVNLFVNSSTDIAIGNQGVNILQQNSYPWNGGLKFAVSPKSPLSFNLLIRIPGWARNEVIPSDLYAFAQPSTEKAVIKVNGKAIDYKMEKGYAVVSKAWKKGDLVEVSLPMEVRKVIANKNVKDDIGKMALQRGPLVYCAEWADNTRPVSEISISATTSFTTEFKSGLLNGVTVLKANSANTSFTAIPYYSWANRGKGEMMVWFPEK